jgi:hypothetical protein
MRCFILFMLLLHGTVLVFAQAPKAFIREMTGTVELKKAGSANWTPAKLNDPIGESTVISTGFKSTAVVAVGNSTLIVRALTRMSLEALMNSDETDTVNIGLSTGRIRADVKPPAGGKTSFAVQTNAATASVRGTAFEMDTINIQVHEGSVRFQPSGDLSRSVVVNAGQESRIDDSGGAVNPLVAAEANLALPSLIGQSPASAGKGAKSAPQSSGSGSLVIEVELTPGK